MIFVQHRSDNDHKGGPRSHLQTEFIEIRSHMCMACGICMDECPKGVIGQVKFLRHTHAHIDRADLCIGCRKCVKACPNHAIVVSSRPGTEPGEIMKPGIKRSARPGLRKELWTLSGHSGQTLHDSVGGHHQLD